MTDPRQGPQPLARASLYRAWLRRSKRLTTALAQGLVQPSNTKRSSSAGFAPGIIVVALMLALMLWALPSEDTKAQLALHASVTADHSSSFAATR